MPYAFNAGSFGHLLEDAERLRAGALHHEHQLGELVERIESAEQPTRDPVPNLLDTVRGLCITAKAHRQETETLMMRLLGATGAGDGAGDRVRVLVVDDSHDNRDLAAAVLEASGFAVLTAGNGLEGVIVAHYARPAVVIMDIMMPVLDGIEAARLLRASAATQDLPLVAYTAKPRFEDGPLTHVFSEVVRKPSSPDALADVVRRLAER